MASLTPSPTEILRAQTTEVVIVGVGTDFSNPGTPLTIHGVPHISDDQAGIRSQVADSSTQVTLQVYAGGAVAVLTITDPASGATCQVNAVNELPALPIKPHSFGQDSRPGSAGREQRPTSTGEDY